MPILYNVKEIINTDHAITKEQGEKVFNEISIAVKSDHKVAIDFSDILSYSTVFTLESIDRLVRDLSPTKFNNLIDIRNLK